MAVAVAAGQVRGGSPAFVGAVRGWSPGLGGAVGPGPAVSPGGTWLPQGVEAGYGVSFGVPREGGVPWALQRGGGRPTRGSGAGSAVPGAAVRGALAAPPPPHRGARGSSDGGTAQKFPVALGERVWASGAASATSSPGGDRRAGAPVPAGGGGGGCAPRGGGVGGRGVFALMDAQGPRLGLSLAGTGQPSLLCLTRARFWAAHGVSGRAGAAPAPSRGGTVSAGGGWLEKAERENLGGDLGDGVLPALVVLFYRAWKCLCLPGGAGGGFGGGWG